MRPQVAENQQNIQPRDSAAGTRPLGSVCARSLQQAQRFAIMFLMVGFTYLTSKAYEPLVCLPVNGHASKLKFAPDIDCDWCDPDFKLIFVGSIVFLTLYSLGTSLLFFSVLRTNRKYLKTAGFMQQFGFLSNKMREENYLWELVICFRKLVLVLCAKAGGLSASIVCVLVVVFALAAQVWQKPFAHDDANIVESLMLLSTVLVLVLGIAGELELISTNLAQYETQNGRIDSQQENDDKLLTDLSSVVYITIALCCLWTARVLCIRLVEICNGVKHRTTGSVKPECVPDSVRMMLHKRKIDTACLWAGSTSMTGERDVARMQHVFAQLSQFRKATQLTRTKNWEAFFPREMRPAMYAWWVHAAEHQPEDVEDVKWLMRCFDELEASQRDLGVILPGSCCCNQNTNDGAGDIELEELLLTPIRRRAPRQRPFGKRAKEFWAACADIWMEVFLGQMPAVKVSVAALPALVPAGARVCQDPDTRGRLYATAKQGEREFYVTIKRGTLQAGVEASVGGDPLRLLAVNSSGVAASSAFRIMVSCIVCIFTLSTTVVCVTLHVQASDHDDSIVVNWQSNSDCNEDKTPWLLVLGAYYSGVAAVVVGVTAWYARRWDICVHCSRRQGASELVEDDELNIGGSE
jgi:hypothetical protein